MRNSTALLVALNLALLASLLLDRMPIAEAGDSSASRYRLVLVDRCVPDIEPLWCVRLEHEGAWDFAYDRESRKPLKFSTHAEVLEFYAQSGWAPIDFEHSSLKGATRYTLRKGGR